MDMEINGGDAASAAPSEPSVAEVSGTPPGASSEGRIADVQEKVWVMIALLWVSPFLFIV